MNIIRCVRSKWFAIYQLDLYNSYILTDALDTGLLDDKLWSVGIKKFFKDMFFPMESIVEFISEECRKNDKNELI
ncbi:MAG: hypothetical protein ACOC2W_03765 [bacterium]